MQKLYIEFSWPTRKDSQDCVEKAFILENPAIALKAEKLLYTKGSNPGLNSVKEQLLVNRNCFRTQHKTAKPITWTITPLYRDPCL